MTDYQTSKGLLVAGPQRRQLVGIGPTARLHPSIVVLVSRFGRGCSPAR
jgi:hypothetical protein